MEVALDLETLPVPNASHGNKSGMAVTNSSRVAEKFLEENPDSKILIVIDTHCGDSGFFVWKGDPKGDFETTPLLPVSVIRR